MSIKPIEKIPQTLSDKRNAYREMIRNDIQYAVNNNINKFEFDGDYNYKYLAQYAREEADGMFDKIFRDNFDRVKTSRLAEIEEEGIEPKNIRYYGYGTGRYWLRKALYRITARKGADRNHVYMVIYLDNLDDLLNEYIDDSISWEQEKRKRDAERKNSKEAEHD